jgi:hypothetical protein
MPLLVRRRGRPRATVLALLAAVCVLGAAAQVRPPSPLEAEFFDALGHPSIQYARPAADPVALLNQQIWSGSVRLSFHDHYGYLPAVLEALDVQVESQLLVYSKTSLQAGSIGPGNPRAIYFNDSVAVAWPYGGFIEIAAQDPEQGVIFYQLDAGPADRPEMTRQNQCLSCHHAYATLNVPGMLVRSVGTGGGGRPLHWLLNHVTDHRSPLEERWAGWYVTGNTGAVRHLGNVVMADGNSRDTVLTPRTSALPSLRGVVDTRRVLTPHSDVAALLVFDHQMHMMNLLTRVGWEARVAAAEQRPDRDRFIRSLAGELVDYMLFVDEAPLASPVRGSSAFADRFAARGPFDRSGRSLRQLDLDRRLMRYPCSYMIYSPAFDALPAEVKNAVVTRLWQILSGEEGDSRYAHLSAEDRRAIGDILRDTMGGTAR